MAGVFVFVEVTDVVFNRCNRGVVVQVSVQYATWYFRQLPCFIVVEESLLEGALHFNEGPLGEVFFFDDGFDFDIAELWTLILPTSVLVFVNLLDLDVPILQL